MQEHKNKKISWAQIAKQFNRTDGQVSQKVKRLRTDAKKV